MCYPKSTPVDPTADLLAKFCCSSSRKVLRRLRCRSLTVLASLQGFGTGMCVRSMTSQGLLPRRQGHSRNPQYWGADDKFLIVGAAAENNVRAVGHTPVRAHTVGMASAGATASWVLRRQ